MGETHGWALWLTGLPAAGKTTLARALRQRLLARHTPVAILDSDELRRILTPAPTYTPSERDQFYRALVDLAALMTGYGVNVIIAATGNRRAYRQRARDLLAPFAEVWVRCPAEVCRARDPKGLYARASSGAAPDLPGAGAVYEPPEAAEAIVDTDRQTVEDAAAAIVAGIAFLS